MSPVSANAKQIAYWNEQAGPRWVRLRDRLDIQLQPLGQAALGAAELEPGQKVLDVGCGCGASSREAAARVGPAGRVLGVDLSRPMLDRARSAASGIEQLSFLQADAQTSSRCPDPRVRKPRQGPENPWE